MANVTLHFVRKKDQDPGPRMVEAFESLTEMIQETDCQWIDEETCKYIKEKKKGHIYVFEEFGSEMFNHVVSTGNKCYGPVCILACLKNGEAIPQVHPTFCLTMKSCTISCTGIPKDTREVVNKKIAWMSGEVSKDFHDSVTHLIAGEVGSKKYRVAANLNRRIMSTKWIDSLLEMSKHKLVHANDPEFLQKYKCPIFLGLVVTVSGIESKERNQIRDMVESEGGKYTGEMKMNECTHLIVKSAKGQKYQFALKWQLHIVTPKWVIKSLEAGYCQDENEFKVDENETQPEQNATSTPAREKGNSRFSSISDVSAISVSHVDESAMFNHTVNQVSMAHHSTMRMHADSLESIDLQKWSGDFFLDGCNIFLSGFTSAQMEKLKKMLNLAGAMRFNDITDNVSHVVIGKTIEEHINQIEQLPSRPFVTTVDWLVESMKAVKSLPEHMFTYMDLHKEDTVVEKAKKDTKKKKVPTATLR